MSSVTNLILITDTVGDGLDLCKAVNRFFEDEGLVSGFVHVEDPGLPLGWYGGQKFLEVEFMIGAFNYLDLEGLVKWLRAFDWEAWRLEGCQLLVFGQQDYKAKLIDIPEGFGT